MEGLRLLSFPAGEGSFRPGQGHTRTMFRRLFRQIGWMTAMTFSWQHRGSVVRLFDLLLRLPTLVRAGRTADALTEARLLVALDQRAPAVIDIRITGIHQGDVVLRGDLPATSLDLARDALLGVSQVVEVRSDGFQQPTLDDTVAGRSNLTARSHACTTRTTTT